MGEEKEKRRREEGEEEELVGEEKRRKGGEGEEEGVETDTEEDTVPGDKEAVMVLNDDSNIGTSCKL